MAKADSNNITRRLLLSSAVSAPLSLPVISIKDVAASPISPAEYLSEMRAIGWRAVASCVDGKPQHVIEYGPEILSMANMEGFCRIRKRIPAWDPNFWKETSRYLYDLGLREHVR